MVVIYNVMYTEHCEYTLRIAALECINNESIDLDVCALAGCTNFTTVQIYLKRYLRCIFGCSKLMLHSNIHLLEERS